MTKWQLAHGRHLDLGDRAVLMGVLNVTPDSFSDGGEHLLAEGALEQARRMADAGATIIDIGGESTRPGAAATDAATEQARILPVIAALAAEGRSLISVDTYRAETARLAVEAGAHIVNDVHGLQREPDIADVAAATGAGLAIMHTGRDRRKLADVVEDQFVFLGRSLEIAAAAGVPDEAIVLDPGFGFAKDLDENFGLIARFSELHRLGRPLMVGTSRKRMIGAVVGDDRAARDRGTAATSAILRLRGASIFRVHDVAINREALAIADAVLAAEMHAAGVRNESAP